MATPDPRRPLLSVSGLTRSFYGVAALQRVDFAVPEHTITALIGPNGAGKTTAFQCISGVIPAGAGTISFSGENITRWSPERISRSGLVRTFQLARGIPRLSVLENLLLYAHDQPGEHMWAALFGNGRTAERRALTRAMAIARRLDLIEVANQPAGALSGGQKKLLEIGRALMREPKLILLDEPIAGVNPTLAGRIGEHLQALREEGMTFLVIEHHMDVVARICDPVIVMAEGRTLAVGRFADIAADARVQAAYLGIVR